MAEAVFTISADITPVLDDRALQQQAQDLAKQLNGILAKQIKQVNVAPVQGSFRPFQQEVTKATSILDKFHQVTAKLPVARVAREASKAFLKFTDVVDITRRDIVGYGDTLFNTIRNTNRFRDAIDGIQASGSTISDLPQRFETLSAQIRSGTSVVDRFAQGGDKMAQMFQPVLREGEAARTEFVELNRSVDLLTNAVGRLASASTKSGSIIDAQFGQPVFNQQIKGAEELLNIVKDAPILFDKMKGSIAQAVNTGTTAGLVQELVQMKDEAQKITGPLGRIAQFINESSSGRFFKDNTRDARELAIELEQGAIAQIRKLGASDVLGPIENLNARIRAIGEGIKSTVTFINNLRTGLASVLPGSSPIAALALSIKDAVSNFRVLNAVGVPALQAIRLAYLGAVQQFKTSPSVTGILSAIQTVKSEFVGLGLLIGQTSIGQKIAESTASAGDFLNKNLVAPLRSSIGQMKTEFSKIGKDISSGLSSGISAGKTAVFKRMSELGSGAIATLRTVLKSHSDSIEAFNAGKDTSSGYAHGVASGQGMVNKAMAGLGDAVKALGIGDFLKSTAAVAATTFAGLGAVALKTGADFNVLKQVIGSTLPVLVGSKQGAADLLVEVNKLNDSSPFARSTFLELTQTLAGFGVEAKKITPLIDAIQQTVAATGGSDQDLLELGQAFAKIQSQGKVSADVLQSFSVRGVDAVAVLAKGFNKTTGEMRTMISDGLVPADQAIDLLTKGLKTKFDGATEAVAKNFPGALQRVQARLRDIGGSLLKTFINPAGGGALVDFLNNMADSLSHINKELIPKLQPALVVVGNLLVSFSQQVENVVKSLSAKEFGDFVNKLKPWLPLLAGIAGLAPAAFGWVPVVGPLLAGLGGPFTAIAAAIGVFLAQSGQLGNVMTGITGSFSGIKDSLGGTVDDIKNHLGGFATAIVGSETKIGGGIGVVQKFVSTIGGVGKSVTSIVPVVSKFGEVFNFLGGIVSKFIGIFDSLASKVLPTVAKLFPKLAAEGGALAGVFKVLSGPIGIVISIVTQLILTSARFRDALKNLWNAVQPVVQVIGGALALAIRIVDEAIKSLEPIFTAAINILAAFFKFIQPAVEKVQAFIDILKDNHVIENFFAGLKTGFELIIGILQKFIDTYNSIPLLPNIDLKLVAEVDVNADNAKKAQKELKERNEALRKAAMEASSAVEDNFNKAAKAAEQAKTKMDGAIDSLKQGLSSIDQKISPLFEAAKGIQAAAKSVTDARQSLVDAQTKQSDDAASFTKLLKDQARAIEDVIKPVDELGVATRNLTRIQNGLRDSQRQLDDMAKERAKLTGQEAADTRAGLARSEERATISLNKAKQAQLDLENELNNAGKVSIDLTGLSLDQIRAKLATARNAAKANGKQREQTAQEIADARTTARLDVEDAGQGVRDAKAASLQFEEDTKNRIRDIDEQSLAIQDDIKDKKLDEQTALTGINRLRAGENALAQVTLDFDEKIRDAKKTTAADTKAIETASAGIKTATEASQLASANFALASATIRGNVQDIATAQQAVWAAQEKGLTFDIPTRNAIDAQKSKIGELLKDYQAITAEVQKRTKLEAGSAALGGVDSALKSFETIGHTIENSLATGNEAQAMKSIPLQDKAKNDLLSQLRAALNNGAAEQKDKNQEPWFPRAGEVEAVIRDIVARSASGVTSLRDAIRDALNVRHLSMPGFAAAKGLSPGMIHRGMHDGKGLVRMFEYGKEAVLPLTRPTDMARIVGDPSVLPAILNALPLPGFATGFAPNDIFVRALSTPNNSLRKILQQIFDAIGLQFPAFAEGYAPGDTVKAPSMAPLNMSSIMPFNMPTSVPNSPITPLSSILNALPRWSSPTTSLSTPDNGSTDLADIVRSARSSGGPANADIYEKKSQREFAGTIGEAVKVAMAEAIASGDFGGNNDVDIHVNPNATETQRAIAREVKRQFDKMTGKW